MKVEHPRSDFTRAVSQTTAETGRPAPSATPAGGDAVRFSGDLKLAGEAVRAAQSQADVRPEAVNRAREILARGLADSDLDRLADRLIDAAILPHDSGKS